MPSVCAYRTTTAGAGPRETEALLLEEGFLCRTAFARTAQGRTQLIPHIRQIRPGDELHVYYAEPGGLRCIGSFLIEIPPYGLAEQRAPAIGLVREDSDLAARLEELHYPRDPHLGSFTGLWVAPLEDGTEPPGEPRFAGRNAIGTFAPPESVPARKSAPAQRQVTQFALSSTNVPSPVEGAAFGIDWSGGQRAGDKIWVARLDLEQRKVVGVDRPWRSRSHPDVAEAVAAWLAGLEAGWVALDAPFALAAADQLHLLGSISRDPRGWAADLIRRYPDRLALIAAVAERGLIGRNRRRTDRLHGSPFAPTLLQLIHQTYAALQLLSRLDRVRIRILPWEHGRDCPVTLVETCPAVLLKSLGLSNRGYKLRPGSEVIRRHLLSAVLGKLDCRADDEVARIAPADAEGDALDAIFCALGAVRAITRDHAEVARYPNALEEGWIYA